jgi:hypothetical protein
VRVMRGGRWIREDCSLDLYLYLFRICTCYEIAFFVRKFNWIEGGLVIRTIYIYEYGMRFEVVS